ncbi:MULTISPECIES: hypothetical protein [Eubacteriales]|jgi:hypothetical protein|uniref:Uncharacterized protein n=2 Tax=Caproicibacterium TaxID=2834348 RepID=A0A859DQY9_9FIRM|nr:MULTISPECIES: hypothetical protein [Caproicibacterium]ARP50243.1 hypothetical protein B6259_04735 [Ruminococcaceae bacterium CPB6]QKN24034.1 hypothetical protein GJQ69_05790 [Caproicibacterium lactatifermentans]QKO30895.1 hypothetical protein GKP14_07750 [Caproicibacterium lactatifermentans]WOC31088.1 hypothetical protein PXC00_07550 [Caproicibacterium argilliputei]
MDQKTKENPGTGSAGPPKPVTLPLPKELSRCKGCPYPGIGFICWNTDGTCIRTDEEEMNRRDGRRRRK